MVSKMLIKKIRKFKGRNNLHKQSTSIIGFPTCAVPSICRIEDIIVSRVGGWRRRIVIWEGHKYINKRVVILLTIITIRKARKETNNDPRTRLCDRWHCERSLIGIALQLVIVWPTKAKSLRHLLWPASLLFAEKRFWAVGSTAHVLRSHHMGPLKLGIFLYNKTAYVHVTSILWHWVRYSLSYLHKLLLTNALSSSSFSIEIS